MPNGFEALAEVTSGHYNLDACPTLWWVLAETGPADVPHLMFDH